MRCSTGVRLCSLEWGEAYKHVLPSFNACGDSNRSSGADDERTIHHIWSRLAKFFPPQI